MKVLRADRTRVAHAADLHVGIDTRKRHCRIGRLRSHACVRPPEDRQSFMMSLERGTTGPGLPLVAAPRQWLLRAEIRASRLLQDVAAQRRAIADLSGCGLETGLRQHRHVLSNEGVLANLVER